MMFWILYPNWGSTLYGEVRGAGDFRKVLNGMLGGIWVTIVLALVFVFLAAKTFGWTVLQRHQRQLHRLVLRLHDHRTRPIPIWSYPPLLVSFLIDNRIFQIGMVVVFGAWFLGWSGTLFLSSTRMIFAAAFDRVLPESRGPSLGATRGAVGGPAADHGPVGRASARSTAYSDAFVSWTLDASLVIAVTFFGTRDRRHDPALVQARPRQLADRALPIAGSR